MPPINVDSFASKFQSILTADMVRGLAVLNALSNEVILGGNSYVDHPDDPGGATNWGISLRFLRKLGAVQGDVDGDIDGDGDVDADDIKALTLDQAAALYIEKFWTPYGFDQLPPRLAIKVFDMAVNMGPVQAVKLLQKSLRLMGQDIAVDGRIGPKTIQAVKDGFDFGPKSHGVQRMMENVRLVTGAFYEKLIEQNPAFKAFANGWQSRAET